MLRQIWKSAPLSQMSSFASFRRTRKGSVPNLTITNARTVLDFANPLSYNGTGATVNDLSGNGNNASLTNSPAFSKVNGGYLTFNGVNTYGNLSAAIGNNPLTISFWIKTLSSAGQRVISKDSGGAGSRDWFVQMSTTSVNFGAWNASNTLYSTSVTATFNSNIWYHVTATYDNVLTNTIKIFINGIEASSSGITGAIHHSAAVGVEIGKGPFGEYLNASLGQLSVYTSATEVLSPAEIWNNFNANRSRYGI